MPDSDAVTTNCYSASDVDNPMTEGSQVVARKVSTLRVPQTDNESIAYQLLLLEQRLESYEKLHREEMAELRKEIERLRRAFLQETNPSLRIVAPLRDLCGQETNPSMPVVIPPTT